MVKDIQQASRQLNKRQMTWFRDDPMYLWLDAKQPVDKLVDQIASSLAEAKHTGMFCSVESMCVSCTRFDGLSRNGIAVAYGDIFDAACTLECLG